MIRAFAASMALAAGLWLAVPANAQTTTINVTYPAGWNMVGGPPGLSLAAASYLYAYGPSGYFVPASTAAALCQGYWALFGTPAAVVLPATDSGQQQVCALQAGYTMVGNPFGATALLPGGTLAYYWSPATSQYQPVSSIPPGGAVWIYSQTASSVLLTSQSVVPPTATLVISDLTNTGPFQVHVGDEVKLLLPSVSPHVASAAPSGILHLEGAGLTGPMSCTGASASDCTINLVNQFWLWKATAQGSATITVQPDCTQIIPCPAGPPNHIYITVLP